MTNNRHTWHLRPRAVQVTWPLSTFTPALPVMAGVNRTVQSPAGSPRYRTTVPMPQLGRATVSLHQIRNNHR